MNLTDKDLTEVGEQWLPIRGYEGLYEISNMGRVKSVERTVINPSVFGNGNVRTVPERIRKPNIMKGYHCIALINNKHTKVYRIHRLVMEHFGKPQPSDEYQVNHIDGDKSNNGIDNLEWVTPKENTVHAFNIGLRPKHMPQEVRQKISESGKKAQNKPERLEKNRKGTTELWRKRKEEGWTSWKTWKIH